MEKDIWNFIKKGDEKAFETFFKTYYKYYVLKIFQLTKDLDLAEDIVQQTFIDLWEKRKKIFVSTSLKSFVYKMSYNKFIDNIRYVNRQNKLLEELKHITLKTLNEEGVIDIRQLQIEKLNELIDELPNRCKEIFLLSKRDDLKNIEIAKKLNISIKTVENQMTIAYKRIRYEYKKNKIYK